MAFEQIYSHVIRGFVEGSRSTKMIEVLYHNFSLVLMEEF